jgi:3',5'-nucleoside bisphosphate phosphatase
MKQKRMGKVCDLHTHSTYSDGEFSPQIVVKKAKKKGIKVLALTDHNSVRGIKHAIKEGKKQGIRIIPAVEVRVKGAEILGYFIDYKNKKLQKELKKYSCGEYDNAKQRLINLKKIGCKISHKELIKHFPDAKGNLNVGHIIYYLNKKGFSKNKVKDYMSKSRFRPPADKNMSIASGIKLIKKYNGIPVLAHPWIGEYTKEFKFTEKNIKKLIKLGLKGLEINNHEGYNYGRTPSFVKKIRKFAKKYNLILTSGSDFHGEALFGKKKYHVLGASNCSIKVVKQLENLKNE